MRFVFNRRRRKRTQMSLGYDVVEAKEPFMISKTIDAYDHMILHWGKEKDFFEDKPAHSKLNALILGSDNMLICRVYFHPTKRINPCNFEEFFGIIKKFHGTKVYLGLNHPDKDVFPTENEEQIARQIKELGAKKEVNIVDQIILSAGTYFSFANNGV